MNDKTCYLNQPASFLQAGLFCNRIALRACTLVLSVFHEPLLQAKAGSGSLVMAGLLVIFFHAQTEIGKRIHRSDMVHPRTGVKRCISSFYLPKNFFLGNFL
jgi:hypothetical protein